MRPTRSSKTGTARQMMKARIQVTMVHELAISVGMGLFYKQNVGGNQTLTPRLPNAAMCSESSDGYFAGFGRRLMEIRYQSQDHVGLNERRP